VARAEPQELGRRAFLTTAGAGVALAAGGMASTAFAAEAIPLSGRLVQGGYAFGRAEPRARILVNGQMTGQASASGAFVIGFDRDAHPDLTLETQGPTRKAVRKLTIAPTKYDVQRVGGLAADMVNPTDPKLLERIKHETALKAEGFASHADGDWFKDGFNWPLAHFVVSGRFGNQRILNGEPKPPHYGIDLAAGTGTQIHAPAPGLVTLAVPDMHFDGGITLIDHGQGLISCCLHQSKQLVHKGDFVQRGQVIGMVGMTGRATGPHLCWRLKWRDAHMDPSLLVGGRSPA
jgi:murein DD-endopeptidase MepM/ murein hydrolase activator NlpD